MNGLKFLYLEYNIYIIVTQLHYCNGTNMYVWVCTYAIGIYIYVGMYIGRDMNLYVYAYISICIYTYMYVCRQTCTYTHMLHISMYTCMCMYICICVNMYIG